MESCTSGLVSVMTRKELNDVITFEKALYGFSTRKQRIWGMFSCHPSYRNWRWLYASRMYDYYNQFYNKGFVARMITLYYLRKRNKSANQLGFDIGTCNIGKGLLIYHPGATIINGSAIIGENCILHGNNCIGNKGPKGSPCPFIGDNVEIGVGAKVIGDVKIADNITIGAGAVVIHSFTEEGITIGGVPAKKIK